MVASAMAEEPVSVRKAPADTGVRRQCVRRHGVSLDTDSARRHDEVPRGKKCPQTRNARRHEVAADTECP